MKKFIKWLKGTNENAKARAKLVLHAKERMACMDELWRQEADKSCDAVALLLMRIGVAHIEALYQGKMMEQNVIRGKQAYLN